MFMECNEFGEVLNNYVLSCGEEKLIISNYYGFDDHRAESSLPFYVATDTSLKYTWIIDGNKYIINSGGPVGVFASCKNKKAEIFYFAGMNEMSYQKIFFDDSNNSMSGINCFDSNNEHYRENNPENFTIDRFKDGKRLYEFKPLENGKEICQEIKEKYQELEETIIDTSDWQTYRNEEFGFEVKYPEDWNIYEDYHFPIFGIYKDEKGSFQNNNISIAPRGIGTNAEPGKRQIIENPTQEIGKSVQLITKSGNPYSYNISFDDYPVSWGDDGFILANAETKNRKTECITDKGIQCSNFDEESEFTVLEADVNSEDWIIINQILSTFKFIEKRNQNLTI